jgi:hypothetical protein
MIECDVRTDGRLQFCGDSGFSVRAMTRMVVDGMGVGEDTDDADVGVLTSTFQRLHSALLGTAAVAAAAAAAAEEEVPTGGDDDNAKAARAGTGAAAAVGAGAAAALDQLREVLATRATAGSRSGGGGSSGSSSCCLVVHLEKESGVDHMRRLLPRVQDLASGGDATSGRDSGTHAVWAAPCTPVATAWCGG